MTLSLHSLRAAKGARTSKPKRVGRGGGSGKGTSAGRGTKGQKARTGGRNKLKMLGIRRIVMATPKLRGFKSHFEKSAVVNLVEVANVFAVGIRVTPASLAAKGLVPSGAKRVKILGGSAIIKKLTIVGCEVSASAKSAIEAQGGSVTYVE